MKKLIFEKETEVFEKNQKTNLYFPFEVNEEFDRLVIEYSYSPKLLSEERKSKRLIEENIKRDAGEFFGEYPLWENFLPLKNLITLSLDSPGGYLGAAHRQSENQIHIISREFSSPGFQKTKIEIGQWRLALNLHAVVTEKVKCSFKIFGEKST